MGIRVNRLLSELNIGLSTLDSLLKALGYKEDLLSVNTKIPDEIATLARVMFGRDTDYTKIIKAAADKDIYGGAYNSLKWFKPDGNKSLAELVSPPSLVYSKEESFWISELLILSADNNLTRINTGTFEEDQGLTL